jgi:hypothetical protein
VNASWLLASAKAQGIFPTLEEAILTHASQGWEEQGVNIISISNVDTSPAIVDGVSQYVRWGCAEILLDRVPAGHRHSLLWNCTQYVHTREGWVLMGESYSPFVGWVMKLYHLEGVD